MIPYYQCEVCKTTYTTRELAEACEAQEPDLIAQPGDIVTCFPCYGWYDGDRKWLSNLDTVGKGCSRPGSNCFDSCCNYLPYRVVTAVTVYETSHPFHTRQTGVRKHRAVYHLATRAFKGKGKPYIGGWTTVEGHHRPTFVDDPPPLRTSDLIGLKFGHLI